jgi:peptidoglycan/xylan/chitin deacetylase (PgdA/CDA1 family)
VNSVLAGLKILNYHNIDTPPQNAALSRLYVTPERFDAQCRMLQRLGYQGVTLSAGLDALARGESQRCVALTFDDGYVDNLVHAAPILAKYGFRATCFVVSDLIGSHNVWDAANDVQKPLMSLVDLRRWVEHGNEIGSHTSTHPHLNMLSRDTAQREIAESRSQLQQLTGAPIDHFCYPYGAFTATSLELVRAAGYRSAVTTRRGIARSTDDPLQLPRISIHGGKSLWKFALKTATPYAAFGGSRAA